MQVSQLIVEKDIFYLKGKHDPLASKIFAELRIKQPQNMMTTELMNDYINPKSKGNPKM